MAIMNIEAEIEDLIKEIIRRIVDALEDKRAGDAKEHAETLFWLRQSQNSSPNNLPNWTHNKPFKNISEKHV